jgi:hypothetical protein
MSQLTQAFSAIKLPYTVRPQKRAHGKGIIIITTIIIIIIIFVITLMQGMYNYSKTCLKRNAIVPVFFSVLQRVVF